MGKLKGGTALMKNGVKYAWVMSPDDEDDGKSSAVPGKRGEARATVGWSVARLHAVLAAARKA